MLYVNDDNIVVRSFFPSFLFVELYYDASVQFFVFQYSSLSAGLSQAIQRPYFDL